MQLAGRVAIVTGGAQGIGSAIARCFAEEGAAVMIADINAEAAQATLTRIESLGGQARFMVTDVSNRDQVETLFDATLKVFGRFDILVNNAAITQGPSAVTHFLEIPDEAWNMLIAIHLNGLFYCSQRAARIMVKQGQGGCIINMSSAGATRAHREMVAYDMTKGGIEAATRAMALDLAPWNIRVNAIAPGAIDVVNRLPVGREDTVHPRDVIPLGRLGAPKDIAKAAVYLASDSGAYVTGHTLFVDGGLTAQLRSPLIDRQPDLDRGDRLW